MYRQMNEEIERVPWTVKTLLCLSFVSTLLLIVMLCMLFAFVANFRTLLVDASATLGDMKRVLPDVQHSIHILNKLCNHNPDMC